MHNNTRIINIWCDIIWDERTKWVLVHEQHVLQNYKSVICDSLAIDNYCNREI